MKYYGWIISLFFLLMVCPGEIWSKDKKGEMGSSPIELKELEVKKDLRMVHIVAFVRDNSLLTTYTDTAFLFREKWVDFMLPLDRKNRDKGWRLPRILSSKSYFRFTNDKGIDSVSHKFEQHFSWSDWINPVDRIPLPKPLRGVKQATDTIYGKYSPTETWIKDGDTVTLKINVLADQRSRKWVPRLSTFFSDEEGQKFDFEDFRITYHFRNIADTTIYARDITQITAHIASEGRGRNIFRFNPVEEPYFTETSAEMYIIDYELLTSKEAKKWENDNLEGLSLDLAPPSNIVPPITPEIAALISRVESAQEIDEADARARLQVDQRLAGRPLEGYSNAEVIRRVLLNALGIKTKRKYNKDTRRRSPF